MLGSQEIWLLTVHNELHFTWKKITFSALTLHSIKTVPVLQLSIRTIFHFTCAKASLEWKPIFQNKCCGEDIYIAYEGFHQYICKISHWNFGAQVIQGDQKVSVRLTSVL